MGKAYKAPPPSQKRFRYVASHALERLRERIIALDLDHRLDGDLTFWLDAAVEDAIRDGSVEAILDRHQPARLVNFGKQLGAPAFAIVKSNDNKRSPYSEAVVTVMDDVMVAQYRDRSVWKSGSKLAQQLSALPAGTIVKRDAPVVKRKVPVQPWLAATSPTSDEQILLSYVGTDGVCYEVTDKEAVRQRLQALIDDDEIENETIRAWREIPSSIRVKVDIDIDI